ncbi:hypothetical protein [Neptuniibacter sp. QD37_11]|uniref:hypothetical protein n=1 Tax=Neptuniibacter sp. QD37_11 TaxID=3398209 RepID=UPI0039F4DE19
MAISFYPQNTGKAVFISTILAILVYFFIRTPLGIQADKKWDAFYSKSEAHQILGKAYRKCRRPLIARPSQQQCIIEMKEYAEIEGLEESFDTVYADLKVFRKMH